MLKTKFGREITVILLVKLLLLYGLWSLCFKEHKQKVSGADFGSRIYGITS